MSASARPAISTSSVVDLHILWSAGLIAGAAIVYRYDPRGFPFHCPFHALTGLACPGCGTLRTAHCLVHGDVVAAFSFNPLLVMALPLLAAMYAEELANRWAWFPFPKWEITRRLSPIVPWVVIGYWILRNLPFWPFTLLLPSP